MKILYLSDSEVPSTSANSVHVMKMCQALSQLGDEVTLHCYDHSDGKTGAFGYYGVSETFVIARIRETQLPGLRRALRMISARAAATRKAFDLIYCRDLFSAWAALGAADLIYEAHVPPANIIERFCIERLIQHPRFKGIVVISEALKLEFIKLFPKLGESRLLVAHDAADYDESAKCRPALQLPGSNPLKIGYVGSLLPGKGAELLGWLGERLPNFDFHIVGGLPHELERLRRAHRSSNLFLHGHVPHALVPQYLAEFDIAMFPMESRVLRRDGVNIANWTSPLKLFEYMAASKAIVASDLPAIREILTHGTSALLLPRDELESWIDAICRLAESREMRDRLGRSAYCAYLTHHTWSNRAERVHAFAAQTGVQSSTPSG